MKIKPNAPVAHEVITAFTQAMAENGIVTDSNIIADGTLHRIKINGHRSGTLNGAYVLHLDGHPAGYFEDFTTGVKVNWKYQCETSQLEPIDREAIEAAKAERAKAAELNQQQAAKKAQYIISVSELAPDNYSYCVKKGIKAHGAKIAKDGRLIVPLFDENGEIVNIQFITNDGVKRFLKGGKTSGCFWSIGNPDKPTEKILLYEGFATGASLHEASNHLIYMAFSAGNLLNVAKIVRGKHPDAKITVCGDLDPSGVGQEKAHEAAAAIDALISFPPLTDWNDFLVLKNGGRSNG